MGMLAAARPAGAADGEKRTGFYMLETFYLQQGAQVPRMHDYLSKVALPALQRVKYTGPVIFLESLVAPHMPQMIAVYGFQSLEELWSVHTRIGQDTELMKNFEQWDSGDAPFEQVSNTLLQAADYSPEVVVPAEPPKMPRLFELRVYHSPTWRQLKALHERFAGPEIQIFHRVGINPVLYTSTLFGANMPNLTYLIPFESLAAREKAWEAFAADPDWIKVRKESIEKHGQMSSIIQISLFKATPYSPVR
jgi:NIPSNAP